MNWLAHLWLADHSATSMAGQLLGDIIKGRLETRTELDAPLLEGIRLHRRIDSAADAHPRHHDLRARFAPPLRRYAGILVDIGLDHALARHWQAHHPAESLERFAERATDQLNREWPTSGIGAEPPEPRAFARLLASYRQASGIAQAVRHVSARLQRRGGLADASAGEAIQREGPAFENAIAPVLADLLETVIAARHET
ncbi:ACP phosphodiesterase [Salinisphaera sp. Q1T1-3]|uniref:ACP phosphodiesterase n=1 Tax=Salinisphaera sp. Q1T1-3 TaxID=2321229 RepID=UPI000E772088|nr:ACP phosphodiesterase [Salinisphaera sp. Q1T1-3]RJS95229.1 DUF479 domain-containing protein [Salinisphaera sp. Q1T1-3]